MHVVTLSTSSIKQEHSWCTINPDDRNSGPWTELPNDNIYIPNADSQESAKTKLNVSNYVKIDNALALKLLQNTNFDNNDGAFYLVRTGAFFDGRNYKYLKSTFKLMYSATTKNLSIIQFSLSHSNATPKNIALIIKTNLPVHQFESICATAQ